MSVMIPLDHFSNTQRPAAARELAGIMIYNTSTRRIQFCDGESWRTLVCDGPPPYITDGSQKPKPRKRVMRS